MAITSVKTGVNAFREGTVDTITKASKENNLSAQDLAKLGGENIGDLLNKVADPNYVDPAKKMRTTGNANLDKDAFMKLMLTQMRHQDPTNPLQSHEMAAQMAQFTSVEQMMNINKNIEGLRQDQKPMEGFQALNFIGKAVAGDSSQVTRLKGDTVHELKFTLPENVADLEIRIRGPRGDVVNKIELKDLKQGENSWTWNGLDERGLAAPAGDYKFFLEGKTALGKKVAVKTDFEGVISGVNYSAEGPVLLIGNKSVKLKDVKKIVDPSLMRNDQNSGVQNNPDLKNTNAALQTGEKEVPKAQELEVDPQESIMDSVSLSREMQAKIQREMK